MTDAVTWVLEAAVFPESHAAMRDAAVATQHLVIDWSDDWLADDSWPRLTDRPVVFHGSLGNAAEIARRLPWLPGAFCDANAFSCSAWYPRAQRWLLHRSWTIVPACDLVAHPERILSSLGAPDSIFVRPNSPLKPFSGRLLNKADISLRALDHGFYFEDDHLQVVVAPPRKVGREWRYVIVGNDVIAGSAYRADGRSSLPDSPDGEPWKFASSVAHGLESPQDVYVMDVCEADGSLHLLELNPFSGADLYACSRTSVIEAVSRLAASVVQARHAGG